MRNCTACGKEQQDYALYCSWCGADISDSPIIETTPSAPPAKDEIIETVDNKPGYFCSYCGTRNRIGAKFCDKCGKTMMPHAAQSRSEPYGIVSGHESYSPPIPRIQQIRYPDDYMDEDAMSARRGYATLDENLRISYTLNGKIMGSILTTQGSTYIAKINIEDPDGVSSDAITLVEIISDGGAIVASKSGDSTTFDWTVTLNSETASYFYLRVTTASDVSGGEGVTAWTAPVWTGN